MAQTKQIPREAWADYCSTFTNGNKARAVSIEMLGEGAASLTNKAPFLAMDFGPAGKGNNIVVSTGSGKEISMSHEVLAPTELWESTDDEGQVMAIEIVDQNGGKTILDFEG
jgi:Family of unknown function (DUF5335)